ncbi:BtrH N-terminal domain-containing protein [Anaerosacchariphilus polymeriproducens]|uniref:Uncharacterized protein n=1 Tax=Anaerosacchariphilus polymeriproducens TaxID=1812858 RepID=A0A371ASD2_9FIRM|nr:BtrH N-terminal domain-containing protein [Anaerosacchariphilus polymeriproducens]RDU22380.1 hypothetical protein DWV06_13870 [Anaerosacchariphilus polymeriproducens]
MIFENEYRTMQNYECLSSCISNYLIFNKHLIKGSDIIFLGDGFKITYNNDTKTINSNMYSANTKFLNNYNIQYEDGQLEERSSAIQFLEHAVKKNERLILKVSTLNLNYNRVFNQTDDSPHYINVIGLEGNEVRISDGCVPTIVPSKFEGLVLLDDIINSWEEKHYKYLVIRDDYIKLENINIKNIVNVKVQEGISSYLRGGSENNFYYGYDAIKRCISNLYELIKNDNFYVYILELNYELRVYGFFTLKNILLDKMKDSGISQNLCFAYEEIIKRWNYILMLLVKLGVSKNIFLLDKLKNKINQCNIEEKRILEELVLFWNKDKCED